MKGDLPRDKRHLDNPLIFVCGVCDTEALDARATTLAQHLLQAQEEQRTMAALLTECLDVLGSTSKTREQRALFERLRDWQIRHRNASVEKEASDDK